MAELPSSFNPEEATKKWNEVVQSERTISNQDLFEIARDIVYLNWRSFEQYRRVYLEVPVGRHSLLAHIELTYDAPVSADVQREAISIFVDQGRGHDKPLSLRHDQKRGRFSTWVYRSEITSMLTDDVVSEDRIEQIGLRPQHRRSIAQKLWEAHLFTLQRDQQETA